MEETLVLSQSMMFGVSVLRELHSLGVNSTVEENNHLQEFITPLHSARQVVQPV